MTLWGSESATYLWRCRVRDRAGNVSQWSEQFSVNFANDPDVDLDVDGLSDGWEALYFADLDFSDGTADSDGDGFTDAEEFGAGTHPFEFQISVDRGWNLLSVPFSPSTESLSDLLAVGSYWRLENGAFQRGELPRAYEGFWFYAEEPAEDVSISGIPAQPELSLLGGWNLVGPRDAMTMPDNNNVGIVYSWDGRRYKTLDADTPMVPFKGYFAFLKAPTTLTLGQ